VRKAIVSAQLSCSTRTKKARGLLRAIEGSAANRRAPPVTTRRFATMLYRETLDKRRLLQARCVAQVIEQIGKSCTVAMLRTDTVDNARILKEYVERTGRGE
jgi:hypothetical protein